MVVKKITRTTTTTTQMIEANGATYIIDRNSNINNHFEFLTDKQLIDKKTKEWIDLDNLHKKEIFRDEEQPNLMLQAEAGEQYALKYIVEVHKADTTGEIGIQNIWWEYFYNLFKERALAWIIGALRGLIKDQVPNMVKFARWLIEKLEDTIITQYNALQDENTKGLIRNELNQYPEFKRLVDKMN